VKNFKKVTCPYCKEEADLTTGREIYPHRKDLHSLKYWICRPFKSYVGCHKKKRGYGDGTRPLGTLANQKLRSLRGTAHRHFDRIWKEGPMTRSTAYMLLANSLEIAVEDCHISQFDIALCEKTIRISKRNKFNKSMRSK